MIVVLAGAPGAGKGTQADLLVERCGFVKVSTGDALRRQIYLGSKVGKTVEAIMAEGRLVSDEILLEVLKAELSSHAKDTVLLDGYPRNINQARTLESLGESFQVGLLVHLVVPEEVLIKRLVERRVCRDCGASYHLSFDPPNGNDTCKKCGGQVVQRPDDVEDKVRVRLGVYNQHTTPVFEFYRSKNVYREVNGNGKPEEVFAGLLALVNTILLR